MDFNKEIMVSSCAWNRSNTKAVYACLEDALGDLSENYFMQSIAAQKPSRIIYYNESPVYERVFNLQECNKELIENAADSIMMRQSKNSGYEGIIRLNISSNNTDFYFTIEDNGTGIESRIEPFLFHDIPSSIQNNKKNSGLNLYGQKRLGLKTVNACILSLGGKLGYVNNFPEGAAFWYKLPLSALEVTL